MRIHWWQSMRWRLALGSLLLALLATSLLALTAVIVIDYYYGGEMQTRLDEYASDRAHSIGVDYTQNIAEHTATPQLAFSNAASQMLKITNDTTDQHLVAVLQIRKSASGHRYLAVVYPGYVRTTGTVRKPYIYLLQFLDPNIKAVDNSRLASAIRQGLQGKTATGEFSKDKLVGSPQPFVVQPIFAGGDSTNTLLGLIVIAAGSDTIPAFVTTVGIAVFIASLIIAVLAALAGILFSQTITRPLAKLTDATRVLASGDYSAQVTTKAPGELGELSHNFNHMAEQLKRDVEELQQQEVWRRELIMNITHDLATPLTAIAGLGEALMDGVNHSREDYEATGHIIMHETLRLRRLVQDLHVMAKVEAGALEPKLKALRLAALVDEVLAVQVAEFERMRVEPINIIPYNLPIVQADADMLKRVFSNLCSNALRYTPAGGSVTIDASAQGNTVVVSFTDSGEGIPEEALGRIFERFYRADGARKSSRGGSGLGLAIVRAIIEAHGGTVWAENAAEAGARITFTLPLPVNEQPFVFAMPTQPLIQQNNGARSVHLINMDH